MNNKIIEYEEAVERIKELNRRLNNCKRSFKYLTRRRAYVDSSAVAKAINKYRVEVNYLLSIIDAHKKMRKMYEELRFEKAKND